MFRIDNDQYEKIFFAETEENLYNLNMRILELEEDRENKDLLEAIFRKIHTLKGMAGAMKYDSIEELTHQLENLFVPILNKEIPVSDEIIDIIFDSIDRIEEIKNNLKEGSYIKVGIDDLVEKIKALSKLDQKVDKGNRPQNFELSFEEKGEIIGRPENIFKLTIEFDKACKLEAARAFLLIKKLEEKGEVYRTKPSRDSIREGKCEGEIKIFYISNLSEEDLGKLLNKLADVKNVAIEEVKEKFKKENIEKISKHNLKDKKRTNLLRVNASDINKLIDSVISLSDSSGELLSLNEKLKDYELGNIGQDISRKIVEIWKQVLSIKMQPIEVILNKYPRMLRDISKLLDKDVDFKIIGGETEVDEIIVREIDEILIHLLRNALDHGIESKEERLEKGKGKVGSLILEIKIEEGQLVISIEDDGRGINYNGLLESVKKSGKNIEDLDSETIEDLIFQQGLTTTENISSISGRGVGMNVVKNKIDSLEGSIEVESEEDLGTKFTIRLPMTSCCIRKYIYEADGSLYGIADGEVKEVIRLGAEDLNISEGEISYSLRCNTSIRVIDLYNRLDYKNTDYDLLLIEIGNINIGILVDCGLGEKDIVIEEDKFKDKDSTEAKVLENGRDLLLINIKRLLDISGKMEE